jgi:hypothetical protein
VPNGIVPNRIGFQQARHLREAKQECKNEHLSFLNVFLQAPRLPSVYACQGRAEVAAEVLRAACSTFRWSSLPLPKWPLLRCAARGQGAPSCHRRGPGPPRQVRLPAPSRHRRPGPLRQAAAAAQGLRAKAAAPRPSAVAPSPPTRVEPPPPTRASAATTSSTHARSLA